MVFNDLEILYFLIYGKINSENNNWVNRRHVILVARIIFRIIKNILLDNEKTDKMIKEETLIIKRPLK